MDYAAQCYRELLRPTGLHDEEDSYDMANAAAYELASAINLIIQSHTK